MTSTIFPDARTFAADALIQAVIAGSDILYLTYGKVDAWANDSSPDIANTSIQSLSGVWNNMIAGIRVLGGDIRHVIPRYNWTANTSYIAYDDTNPTLITGGNQFYVLTSDYNVYKCIANNNNSLSTVMPTSLSTTNVTNTADGYIWLYMYTLNDAELVRFTTSAYIPVKTLSVNDGSLQWQVQQNSIDGDIKSIVVTNSGSNYLTPANVAVSISGDGTGATAIANVTNNVVSSIIVTSGGSGYSYALVSISDSGNQGAGATARAIMSPPGGHGSNPLYELGGMSLMFDISNSFTEEGIIVPQASYRQIALLANPLQYGSNSAIANAAVSLQATTLTAVGTGDYTLGEDVYQGTNLAQASFKGKVCAWDSTQSLLYVINTQGTPTAAQSVIGNISRTARVITGVNPGDFSKYTGQLIYIDNLLPISRSADQIEDTKIVISY